MVRSTEEEGEGSAVWITSGEIPHGPFYVPLSVESEEDRKEEEMMEVASLGMATNHLDATKELLDRAYGHLGSASKAGADTFEIQLAVDKALGLLRVERQKLERKE